ncbi:hypothetical protein Calow_0817 [Caldicellulosiruptor owensensis OL]|uniref:Uncharacterized protein n=1 Tax=Caldicellulosiruptor owensensis (strain ATCC 700167 / DSM 13100 / OL) TaxID=632518 RepID=E4Q611_CALOW|nr:hypothetical protein [Caldicellulosiruptor owensensis]ADQ04385.1 hypothetical protein Calow_0817 [Caldicellulosiruptor owensensis OL]
MVEKIPNSAYAKSSEPSFENLPVQRKEEVSFIVPKVSQKVAEAIKEEMKGMQLKFKRIKMPTGGSTVFEIPTTDPNNPKIEKELVGVIVYHHPMNILWKDVNNPTPDCYSIDGEKGIGEPGGKCSVCPYNQFGAKKGRAKACKNIHRLYLILDKAIPYEFNVPPSSLNNFHEYVQDYSFQGFRSYEIITKITLRKVTNKDGITYAQAIFSMVGVLDEKNKEEMKKFAQSIEQLAQRIPVIDNNEETAEETVSAKNNSIDIEGFEEKLNEDDLPF